MLQSSLNNSLTRGNSAEITSWGMPDFDTGVDLDTGSYSQVPVDCFVYLAGAVSGFNNYCIYLSKDGITEYLEFHQGGSYGARFGVFVPAGYYVKPINANYFFRYYPLKGA